MLCILAPPDLSSTLHLCGPQEIEKLRCEKQQLSRDNAKLSEASKQHKGQSAALLCQLLKKHSQLVEQQTSSCSSISGLSKALAQQYLHSATLHKALLVQYAQHQQQEVGALLAVVLTAGTAAALCRHELHRRPLVDSFIARCLLPAQYALPAQTSAML
jgi:hypothetical protein